VGRNRFLITKVLGSNFGLETRLRSFPGFTQFLQANNDILSQIMPPLSSVLHTLPVIILPLVAMGPYSEAEIMPLNKQ